ncbi:hypothetical protein K503DRAFT_856354 [Rhizopogon vinicolor AM-OR11-026]|uniref:Uncharacterized protein n=1 Tax=Rhizopogon vinicolor AM-OR11-026 TaxID=1314800 RepID=A0A1B7N272_9AGAM|nr:hypothetical protein K503DRAFT_856354 [Rhizopogon vinicolor AM-OR11-026]
MDPSEISPDYELTVRNHIRQIFLPYIRKHITKDHVAYTESKLEQIFTESLDFIPLADPHALVLPSDPLDNLVKSLDSLEPFEERWTTDADTVHKLKSMFKAIAGEGGELCSDAYWRENDHMYTHLAEIYRPMTPALTNRSRQQTLHPGSNALRASLPRTQPTIFEHIGVRPVVVEQVEEFDAPILEVVLNLRPTMDTATRSYVLSQFKLANPPAQSTETNMHVTSFLRADSPPPHPNPRPFSPPLFPGSKANSGSLGAGMLNAKAIMDKMDDVPAPVPEELEVDMDKLNMMIVDGWVTLPISSPPSASPCSSQHTEIDELWEDSPTPLGTPATSLFNARMDDVEVPRIHKPGHALPSTPGPRGPKSLKSLMEHLKPVAPRNAKAINCTTPTKQKPKLPLSFSSAHAEDGRCLDSMLGQPPSDCTASPWTTGAQKDKRENSDRDSDPDDFEMDIEQGFDMALKHVYHGVQEDNIEGCVLEERLDEKDVALMDVPHLPPPTAHSGASLQPTRMGYLVRGCKGNTPMDANLPRHSTLQPVKGIKPLNLELSWRPFKFTPPIPTDEIVTLVEGSGLEDLEKQGYIDTTSEANVHGLLRDIDTAIGHSVSIAGCKNFDDRRGTGNIGLSPPRFNKPFPEAKGFELVLTKRERRLLAGLSEFEDPHEHRAEDSDDRQEQQDEASLVTENDRHVNGNGQLLGEYDRSGIRSVHLGGDLHLHSNFGDLNPAGRSFLHSDGLRFTCGDTSTPPGSVLYNSGVLDSVPGVVLDEDLCGVVFDDSGVIIHDDGGRHRDRVGHPRYPEVVYSPENVGDSDDDKENKFYYTCNGLQDQPQGVENQSQVPFSSRPLSIQKHHGPSSFPTKFRASRGHGQDTGGFFPLSFGAEPGRVPKDPIEPGILTLDSDLERIHVFQPDNNVCEIQSPGKVQYIPENDTPKNVSSFLQYFVLEVDLPENVSSFLQYLMPEVDPPVSKRKRLDDPTATPTATRALLDDHLALRNKPITHAPLPLTTPTAISSQQQASQSSGTSPPRDAPPEIFDVHTIRLPDIWDPPATNHCYLASMALIQKRALLRALRDPECQVHLVERYALGGVDIIMDPDTAVLLAPLLALPCEVEGLTDRISHASWRYAHILVILEAFPSADALTTDGNKKITNSTKLTPYAFSPPMLKAVKKLRRLLSIADGFGTKNAGCEIHWAFANDVGKAALFVRIFGNLAEERALREGRDALWGDRGWLQVDEHEDEADLATAEDMNSFAAFVMLYQRSLQEILDMSSERRMEEFSDLMGKSRIASLNALIEQRAQEMDVDATTESGVGYSTLNIEIEGSIQY